MYYLINVETCSVENYTSNLLEIASSLMLSTELVEVECNQKGYITWDIVSDDGEVLYFLIEKV